MGDGTLFRIKFGLLQIVSDTCDEFGLLQIVSDTYELSLDYYKYYWAEFGLLQILSNTCELGLDYNK